MEIGIIGNSPALLSTLRAAGLVAPADVTTLIQGESGTGKELLARLIHAKSARAGKPFVALNCAALPESLAESTLFGHRKGAFTGAVENHPGVIRSADGGTLFLDEIGELSLSAQAKLLRFLETGECMALGESAPSRVNARIISATNRDLYSEAQAGLFRKDLFYRLNVVPLHIPPLRERIEDLEILLSGFTTTFAAENNLKPVDYSPDAMAALKSYSWPGNVRELKSFCQRMTILLGGRTITPENLPIEFKPRPAKAAGNVSLLDLGMGLKQMEHELIRQALAQTEGNRSQAARILGISRDTLLYRLKKLRQA
jgi:DNA-binding NtrC family response regulator